MPGSLHKHAMSCKMPATGMSPELSPTSGAQEYHDQDCTELTLPICSVRCPPSQSVTLSAISCTSTTLSSLYGNLRAPGWESRFGLLRSKWFEAGILIGCLSGGKWLAADGEGRTPQAFMFPPNSSKWSTYEACTISCIVESPARVSVHGPHGLQSDVMQLKHAGGTTTKQ
jgi:hypothetical protein